jgi:hypothetical protein
MGYRPHRMCNFPHLIVTSLGSTTAEHIHTTIQSVNLLNLWLFCGSSGLVTTSRGASGRG